MRYGHFDDDRLEYVIDRVDVPASWINYLGVEDWCTVINQNAGGYSFYLSSQQGRVTRFRPNGVPLDRPGHYLYLRDDADGDYWSASWQPVGRSLEEASYRTRHGLSYSVFESSYRGIEASQRIFVPIGEDAEVWDVTLTNTGDAPRTLSLFGYVEFSFHSVQIDNENFQMSLYASGADYADGVVEYDFYYEPWTYHYFTATAEPAGFDTLRDSFLGAYRTETNPLAVERGECSGSQATTGNHCGALHHKVTLAPGETVRLAYVLGYGRREVGTRLRAKYADPAAVDAAIADLAAYWERKRSVLSLRTPSAAMNTLLNTWTLLQAETCVVWSRFASFVEVGGRVGLGYRDTAQDVMSVVHTNPGKVRQRMEELLHGQMSWGYGLHLFDPLLFAENQRSDIPVGVKLPTVVPGRAGDLVHGLADACSDDHLWLVPSVLEYVKEIGDLAFLDQVIPFADSDMTLAERSEVMGANAASRFDAAPATVYEHLRRAIEFTAEQVGDNGIAKGLRADWNDCLNLGGGQTALVSFLHLWAANALAEVVEHLAASDPRWDAELVRLREIAAKVTADVNRELWDGDWYIRGYTRDGVKIGSAESPEGKIFLEHMGWAVISGAASRERGESSMDAVRTHLASEYGTHLCWPSYTQVDDTIGYVTRVYPGVKENGAIFSHPNAWPVIAETMLGRGEQAMAYYDALAPYHGNDAIETRGAEPYVYAQFLYGRDHEWFGKAQNPWLTGTAGWMYTAATKYILGIRPEFDALVIDPCIPADWEGFTATRQWRGATYEIEVRNPSRVSAGVASVEVDGVPLPPVPEPQRDRPVARIPRADSGVHRVVITLGALSAK
ncbi:MAG: N,N'-diacetylchitobiose phosphorylase [Actinobacteria bacterium]|nr:N,N'-diacetylchitobiose phosphorylase [Actinomycetota bacterium]